MSKHLFKRWEQWWCRTVPPHALAIFRIAFGLFLFVEALTYVHAVPMLFSHQGLIHSLWAETLPLSFSLRSALYPPSVGVAYALYFFYCACTLTLAIGIAMRTSLLSLILLYLYYWQLSFHDFPSSYHRLFFVALIVLLFSGADRTFSLRMKLRRGSFAASEPISILPQRLLALQISATYLGVGWQKMWLPDWQDGQVLYLSFVGKWATPLGFFLAQRLPMRVFDALVWMTKMFEYVLPFGLWSRKIRIYCMIGGFLFHFLIAITMSIWWFLVLPPAYILFFDPEEVKKWFDRRK